MRFVVLASLLFLPYLVSAQVQFSEIAWMGTEENANDEWIELYSSVHVDLTGWRIEAADGQPIVVLDGAIGAGDYYLLERSDDDTVPQVAAGLVYTGALGNNGETLTLYNADGMAVDTVRGGEDWELGGNNDSKDTLQRTGSSWITAAPTPGAPAPTQATPTNEENSSEDNATKKKSASIDYDPSGEEDSDNNDIVLISRTPTLMVGIDAPTTGLAQVPVRLEAFAINHNNRELEGDEVYVWSFGDGTRGTGKQVAHAWKYPGEYKVVVEATMQSFLKTVTARESVVVTVRDPSVGIVHAGREFIALKNESNHELDLSGWTLAYSTDYFTIPEYTVLLPGSEVRMSREVTGLVVDDPSKVALFFPNRTLAARYVEEEEVSESETDIEATTTPRTEEEASEEEVEEEQHEQFASTEMAPPPPERTQVAGEALAAAPLLAAAPPEHTGGNTAPHMGWWLLGALALAGVGAAATLLIRREHEALAVEYLLDDEDEFVDVAPPKK